ncbi:hypothetical protein KAJ27_23180 [bacterium]|nr:hypothetical protein [bacterium]
MNSIFYFVQVRDFIHDSVETILENLIALLIISDEFDVDNGNQQKHDYYRD